MASLFALGIMSPIWMAVVAVLIAIEKVLPWRRVATYGVTIVLLVLGVLVIVAPEAIPAFIAPMQSMR
jgi:predicted metal-binding membrane protein